jgi:hypothetical protein
MNYHISPYIDVGNNPLLLVDPNGEDWFYYSERKNDDATWHWHDGDSYNRSKGMINAVRGAP